MLIFINKLIKWTKNWWKILEDQNVKIEKNLTAEKYFTQNKLIQIFCSKTN